MMSIYRWVNNEKLRFYNLSVRYIKDAFNLEYNWGSTVTNRRASKTISVNTKDEVQQHINKLAKRRSSRGYTLEPLSPVAEL